MWDHVTRATVEVHLGTMPFAICDVSRGSTHWELRWRSEGYVVWTESSVHGYRSSESIPAPRWEAQDSDLVTLMGLLQCQRLSGLPFSVAVSCLNESAKNELEWRSSDSTLDWAE